MPSPDHCPRIDGLAGLAIRKSQGHARCPATTDRGGFASQAIRSASSESSRLSSFSLLIGFCKYLVIRLWLFRRAPGDGNHVSRFRGQGDGALCTRPRTRCEGRNPLHGANAPRVSWPQPSRLEQARGSALLRLVVSWRQQLRRELSRPIAICARCHALIHRHKLGSEWLKVQTANLGRQYWPSLSAKSAESRARKETPRTWHPLTLGRWH